MRSLTDRTDRTDGTDLLPPAARMSSAELMAHAPEIVMAGVRRGFLRFPGGVTVSPECAASAVTPSPLTDDNVVCAAWEGKRPRVEDYPNSPKGRGQYRLEYSRWVRDRARARYVAANGAAIPDRRTYEGGRR